MKTPGVDKDIDNYVYHQLTTDPDLHRWKHDRAEIQAALTERAQGVFLYVASQLQQPLKEVHLKCDRNAVLQDLPLDMNESYAWLLRSKNITVSLQALVVNTPIVNIAHSLVQHYLESDTIRIQDVAAFAIERGSANRELAQICLVYLKSALSDGTTGQEKNEKFPFALFAAMEWFHYYAACQDKDSSLKDLAFDLFNDGKGGCFNAWIQLHDVDSRMEQLAKHGAGSDVNVQGGRYGNALRVASFKGDAAVSGKYGTALQAASLKGHKEVVDILLSHEADVIIQSGQHNTALQAASLNGHKEVVRALLKRKADVNSQGGKYGNAFQTASTNGHKEVAQLLLERGARVSLETLSKELQMASMRGDKKKAEKLLNMAQKVSNGDLQVAIDTALLSASVFCHEKTVKLLLQKGANVNARGGHLGYPLYAASLTQREMLVQAVYQYCSELHIDVTATKELADGNARGVSFMTTALQEKSSLHRVFEKFSAMLVNDLYTDGFSADFEWIGISSEESEKVVEILPANGADVNAQSGKYGNALQAASHIGNEKVFKILLDNGADVNAQGGFYDIALSAALAGGHSGVEQILRDHQANTARRTGAEPAEIFSDIHRCT
ncbi:uncharacterized protein N7477_004441 [Penicillium maclennaniae]|uniref:uncharacterized protein n=1 Tax=Penicillium maclennaniae TaxID=1343394 RepID=UPI00254204BE|nr:uncharacterized protein N7477_004441 [Penicillium maclennaniae]KAJ5674507.1 hypothetical protein N7477_004441 [Penicillium maclennaniae]